MEKENTINTKSFDYFIIKPLHKTKYGELFLVSNKLKPDENTLYLMKCIHLKSTEEKTKILNEINMIKELNSEYIIKINYYFTEILENKEYICLIFDYSEENKNLEELIYNTYFLTSQNIWRIFIKLLIAIKYIHKKAIIVENLVPQNIFIDQKKNIKIGGIKDILDLREVDTDYSLYKNPGIFNREKCDNKSNMWSLGCILYEMVFKKKIFDYEENINNIYYEIPENSETDIKNILEKLICKHDDILDVEKIIYDPILKRKIIEENLFSEIIQNNIEGK